MHVLVSKFHFQFLFQGAPCCVVKECVCSDKAEKYASSSIATGGFNLVRKVKAERPGEMCPM